MVSASAPASETRPFTPSQLRWLVGGLLLGLFLSSTEQSVVATALPTMAGELGAADRIAWVVSAYLLTSTITTPLYGKMSDLFGRRIVYQVSITMFVIGSACCALAQTMNQLVAARAIQGLGGGGLMSLAFVIVGDVVSPRDRGRYIGLFTTVFTVSAITGPLWGGVLVDGPGWRWIFWVVVPISGLALLVTNRGLRLPFATRRRPIDWLGIGLLVVATTGLILVPIWGGEAYGWTSWQLLAAGGVGVVASALFVAQERRAVEPIIPMRLFGDRSVVAVFVMGFSLMAASLSLSTFMPLFLQVATGVSATRSGLALIPQSLGISLMATGAGFLVSRTGRYKWTMLTGSAVAAVGLWLLTRITPSTGAVDLAPVLFVLGMGFGLIFPNLTLTVQNAVGIEDLGIGTSTSNFFRSLGGAFGAAIGGALLTRQLDADLTARLGAGRLAELGGAQGLVRTPQLVKDLPDDLRQAVVESVAHSVVHVIWFAIPVMVLVWLVALTVKEHALRTDSALGGAKPAAPVD